MAPTFAGELLAAVQQIRTTYQLTQREAETLELAAAGLQNREIGNALGISRHTVRAHLTRAYEKVGIEGRADLPRLLHEHRRLGTATPSHSSSRDWTNRQGRHGSDRASQRRAEPGAVRPPPTDGPCMDSDGPA